MQAADEVKRLAGEIVKAEVARGQEAEAESEADAADLIGQGSEVKA